MLERIVVGRDVLDHHALKFVVVSRVKYEDSDTPDAFVVELRYSDETVGWLQGWEDISYDYLREYAGRLGVTV